MKELLISLILLSTSFAFGGEYKGNLSANKYDSKSTSNPNGKYGSKYGSDSINNKNATGSPYNRKKLNLYDKEGNFKGCLNCGKYDSKSVNNPNGKYGSRYSQDSINNPNGQGSKYRQDSPNNPHGKGLKIIEEN